MTIQRIGNKNVVVPENRLDREILERLLIHMKPDTIGDYWNPKTRPGDPLDDEDRHGRIYVTWKDVSGEDQIDPFCIFKDESGNLQVAKALMPATG